MLEWILYGEQFVVIFVLFYNKTYNIIIYSWDQEAMDTFKIQGGQGAGPYCLGCTFAKKEGTIISSRIIW